MDLRSHIVGQNKEGNKSVRNIEEVGQTGRICE